MTLHIIFNPTAHSGGSIVYLRVAKRRLQEAGVAYVVHETLYKGHAEELAREYSQGAEAMMVVGGDGTIHEVLNGITDLSAIRLAILPAGTGNDFCTHLGIPRDPERAMDIVLRGETKPTDYIEAGFSRCMNVGGFGMDVAVLEGCAKGRIKSKTKYLINLLKCLFTFRGYRVRMSVNGAVYDKKALFAAVCNGGQIGGGIRICPGATVDDGKLEVVLVNSMGFFGIIRNFVALMQGKILERKKTEHYYCEEVQILPDAPRTVQLDGELYENCRVLEAKVGHGVRIYR